MNDYPNVHNSHMHSHAHSIHHRQQASINNAMMVAYRNGHNIGDPRPPRFDMSDFPALGEHSANEPATKQSSHGYSQQQFLHQHRRMHTSRRVHPSDDFPILHEDFPALPTVPEHPKLSSMSQQRRPLANSKVRHSKLSGSPSSSSSIGPSLTSPTTSSSFPSLSPTVSSSSSLHVTRQAPPPPPTPPPALAASKAETSLPSMSEVSSSRSPTLSALSSATSGISKISSNSALSSSSSPSSDQISSLTSSSSSPSNTGNGNTVHKWGLKGLLNVIRMTDPCLNMLALGTDLTTLGLNLNSSEVLYATFAHPCHDMPTRPQPDYVLPYCYYMHPPALKTSHLSKFQLETLFYIFYNMPKDTLQVYAAKELQSRDWKYHEELKLWFTSEKTTNPSSGETVERWIYFDITALVKQPFDENKHPSVQLKFMSEEELAML